MSTEQEMIPEQVLEMQTARKELQDPYAIIASNGGPSKEAIANLKMQTPNGKLKIFTPDGMKRIFIIRAIGYLELINLSKTLPRNSEPEQKASELELLVASKCTVWTNATSSNKLSVEELKAGSAGLSSTISGFITWMSDYVDPAGFELLSTDL